MADDKGRGIKGYGSIRRKSNGLWEGRVSLGIDPMTGKRIRKSVSGKTRREVVEKMKVLEAEGPEFITLSNTKYVKVEDKNEKEAILYGDWLDTWLKDYKRNNLSPSTYESYRIIIMHHVKPTLGQIPIDKITPDMIQNLLNEKQKKGARKDGKLESVLSASSVMKIKIVINASLKQAVKNRLIPYNPTEAVTPPKQARKEIRILTPEEQERFMAASKENRLEALFKVALATGMRKGELTALTWADVDFENKVFMVTKSAGRVRDPDTLITSIQQGGTKTASGMRQVPMLPSVVPILNAHRRAQEREIRILSSAYMNNNLVFPAMNGNYLEPRRINTTLDKIIKKAGLEHINFHALRHTFATRALEASIPAKVVADILGHSDVALTLNRYTHVLKATAQEQMGKLEEQFKTMDQAPQKAKKRDDFER